MFGLGGRFMGSTGQQNLFETFRPQIQEIFAALNKNRQQTLPKKGAAQ